MFKYEYTPDSSCFSPIQFAHIFIMTQYQNFCVGSGLNSLDFQTNNCFRISYSYNNSKASAKCLKNITMRNF